ncbi:PPOX class probable F420-dependent enzyme [Terracoccus luteus]|uniref:PPOX class probable F420-dependent enzyme n=1 Tax=Terracoccus luteus TaxID=53356 RepID=A0A495Y1W6_9MICO|nr:PPOX class F420-dependent oxidoreductase [Terracoccus luteus]RKT78956.1 PPOX class probable F420-dependent enzyme [Terracoccus luteus]
MTVSERPDPVTLPAPAVEFVTVRHLATLTTLRPDGSPHVVPVGFTWDADAGVARVITNGGSRKVRNVEAGCRSVLCQVDGRYWLSLEGPSRVLRDPASVHDAERRYAARYREPRENPQRVVIEITVDRVLGTF